MYTIQLCMNEILIATSQHIRTIYTKKDKDMSWQMCP